MAKGSGLSFDPDPIKHFLPIPTVLNSFLEPHQEQKQQQQHCFFPITSISKIEPFHNGVTIQRTESALYLFNSVNLNCSTIYDQEHNRPVIGEMDFFADKKNGNNSEDVDAITTANNTANDSDRKEFNTPPPELDFNEILVCIFSRQTLIVISP
ncbi:Transcription factor [Datura stramonium]|uniref:Transcription factor n=1 Tax=Datura stramonium TaxID=4076 RepID=A0ABS8VL98_DATST|nr:Transcription factor [Datura stramonium]